MVAKFGFMWFPDVDFAILFKSENHGLHSNEVTFAANREPSGEIRGYYDPMIRKDATVVLCFQGHPLSQQIKGNQKKPL